MMDDGQSSSKPEFATKSFATRSSTKSKIASHTAASAAGATERANDTDVHRSLHS